MTLRDLHKTTKNVIKFWIRIKITDRSHRCTAEPSRKTGPQPASFGVGPSSVLSSLKNKDWIQLSESGVDTHTRNKPEK